MEEEKLCFFFYRTGRHARVGNNNDDTVWAVSYNLGDDVLEYVDVSLYKVQPALPLLLTDSGCDYNNARVCCNRVV